MYVDDKPLIRYNDFHAALSEQDIGLLEHMRKNPGKVRKRFAGGTGMGDVLHQSTLEQVVAMGRSFPGDEANAAPIELRTVMVAEPGKTIKGEDIYNLMQAAKAENVTVTSKLRDLQGATITTMVSPGPGVVAQAVRSGGRKRKRSNRLLVEQDREWRERVETTCEWGAPYVFLSRRFSIKTSASVSLSWRASALSSLTSSEVASRAVSPASRFLPASRNSFDQR
jgi:hypothetical protein